jgi:glycosyltransferase involved in cell wall biosynthesis
MKILVIYPVLPPRVDGIGDHTALLSAELRQNASVSEVVVVTGNDEQHDDIANVRIVPVFSGTQPRTVWNILSHVADEQPDWVILQYNPFGYGRWGLNLHLPRMIKNLRRQVPGIRIALIIHERYVPVENWKFAVMTTWQRHQYRTLCNSADVLLFTISAWMAQARCRFPRKPLVHLAVGSTIPLVTIAREEARQRLTISPETAVLGIFGGTHGSRLFPYVRDAARAVRSSGRNVVVLHIGPNAQAVRQILEGLPTIADGPLGPGEVSRRLAAVDAYLAPYSDGVSTHRSSLFPGLQHGLPTIGTIGCNTDRILAAADGTAMLLSPANEPEMFNRNVLRVLEDEQLRCKLSTGATTFFREHFSWPAITRQLLSALNNYCSFGDEVDNCGGTVVTEAS